MLLKRVENSYNELLDCIKAVPCKETNVVVECFKNNHPMLFSVRCRSRITSVERLLHELDKGLFIDPLNIDYLKEIVQKIEHTRATTLLRIHDNNIHQYNIFKQQSQENGTSDSHSRVSSTISSGLTPEVKRVVVEKIGQKWMELGRQLSLPEGKLDVIEETCKEPYKRMYKIFDEFDCIVPIKDQKIKLILALKRAKRTDLAEEVEALLLSS